MTDPLAIAKVVLVAVTAIGGATLLRRSQATAVGAALLTAAGCSAAGLWLVPRGMAGDLALGARLVLAGVMLAAPVAALSYPRPHVRTPTGFATTTTVVAAGVWAVLRPEDVAVRNAMWFVIVGGLFLHLWARLETSSAHDRLELQWFTVGLAAAALVAGAATFLTYGTPSVAREVVVTLAFVPVVPAMVVGVMRPETVDVRGLTVQSVVAGVIAIAYVAAFVGIWSVLELAGRHTLTPAAFALIGLACASGINPLRRLLRGVIDRLLFGDRPDPLLAATQVADSVADDPALALRAVREALVLPHAVLRVDGEVLAESGTPVAHTRTLPLRLGPDSVGEIVVGLRAGDLGLSSADEQVLRIVAPLLAHSVRAREHAADLARSRERVVVAIEDERKRLRRDLHDGLGPSLTGMAYAVEAAGNWLRTEPDRAEGQLNRLRDDMAVAIADLRQLVDGLRPPALDELGLVGALRQRAEQLAASDRLAINVESQGDLHALGAATEVAAYRIAIEGLTNAIRHSDATRVVLSLTRAGNQLRLVVCDDGSATTAWTAGTGMTSMSERAAIVGGTVTAGPDTSGPGPIGGRVEAHLPLGAGLGRGARASG